MAESVAADDAPSTAFTPEEISALRTAADKRTGAFFGGGQGKGIASYLRLKAAAEGGPLAADTWNEVRSDEPLLSSRSDSELASAFLQLVEDKTSKQVAEAEERSSSDAMAGAVPIAALVIVAATTFAILPSGSGGCEGESANSRACVEKALRAASQESYSTPLARYRESMIGSSDEFLKSYERPANAPTGQLKASDVSAGVSRLGDADFWKGKK